MKNNRRTFLKQTGIAGLHFAGIASIKDSDTKVKNPPMYPDNSGPKIYGAQNMSGFSAPELRTVRVGFIGLGNRGTEICRILSTIEGVSFKAICDLRPEKLEIVKRNLNAIGQFPAIYTKEEEAWKKLCQRDDIDVIYIATPWKLHTSMAVYAMNQGKHAFVEVPAATTVEECWQLVDTAERTRKHCMMLENDCYDFFQLQVLNMVRQGFFGEIIHGEGAYIHDLLAGNFAKDKYYDMWRLKENMTRNGNLYPTHGVGPVCQIMNINRGDRMDYMVSISGNDFMMGDLAAKLASEDEFYKPYAVRTYRGNMNTSILRTIKGRTISLQHDVTSPRQHVSNFMISGTKATVIKYPQHREVFLPSNFLPLTPRIWETSSEHNPISRDDYKKLEEQYRPEIIKRIGQMAEQVGGHGGMDTLLNWRIIDCLRNGLPLDQDVYDAALWSSLAPLSEWSVKNKATVQVPDFTRGSWQSNAPGIDINLEKGGDTKIIHA